MWPPPRAAGPDVTPAGGGRSEGLVLTAGERRVAELAADGLSNRDVAQALFVTTTTVETHLGHMVSKLAVGGRDELARALAGPVRERFPAR